MKKRLLFISIFLLTGCAPQTNIPPDWTTVSIGRTVIQARVVRTEAEQARGLAGVSYVREGEGMLFPFPKSGAQTFWMKGMLIPIDIIWISNGTVIGIEKSVPPPAAGAVDATLPLYSSPGPVDAVLEVPAGFSDANGIMVGSGVVIKP